MEREIELKVDKLCDRYLKTQARVVDLLPTELPTGRHIRKTRAQIIDVLYELQVSRKGPTAALVKLAYVRGMRSIDPEARLTSARKQEVTLLQERLDHELHQVEAQALDHFRSTVRNMKLVTTLEKRDYPEESLDAVSRIRPSLTMEHHARTSINGIAGIAWNAGVSAARYDSEGNANR